MTANPHTGSDFDDFLKEEGLEEDCSAVALKRLRLRQLAEEMKRLSLTKTEMAARMQTSRAQFDRLLDIILSGISKCPAICAGALSRVG